MSIAFDPVRTADDRQRLAALADEIWHEYWPALIGDAQTDYMVENFQSLEAIERDMREHAYEYWFMRAEDDGRIAGYTGGRVEPETNRFFISKVYLRAEERGKGFASRAIAFYERLCLERGLDAMYLTVNKQNDLGIRAYLGKGFETIDAVETDIGNGFVMDDYIMEKHVERRAERAGSRTRAAPADTSVLPPPRFRAHPDLPLSASVREPAAPPSASATFRSRPSNLARIHGSGTNLHLFCRAHGKCNSIMPGHEFSES